MCMTLSRRKGREINAVSYHNRIKTFVKFYFLSQRLSYIKFLFVESSTHTHTHTHTHKRTAGTALRIGPFLVRDKLGFITIINVGTVVSDAFRARYETSSVFRLKAQLPRRPRRLRCLRCLRCLGCLRLGCLRLRLRCLPVQPHVSTHALNAKCDCALCGIHNGLSYDSCLYHNVYSSGQFNHTNLKEMRCKRVEFSAGSSNTLNEALF